MRGTVMGILVAALASSGCAAASSSPAVLPPVVTAAPGERVATFGLKGDIAWPYWVHRVEVRVGDDTIVDERYGPDDVRPRWLTHAKLPPGEHEVVVVAEVAYASTRLDGGDGCVVRLERRAALDLREGHAAVDVGLRHRGGATTPFALRVALLLDPRRGVVVPGRGRYMAPQAAICDDRAPLVDASTPIRGARDLWGVDPARHQAEDWPHAGW